VFQLCLKEEHHRLQQNLDDHFHEVDPEMSSEDDLLMGDEEVERLELVEIEQEDKLRLKSQVGSLQCY